MRPHSLPARRDGISRARSYSSVCCLVREGAVQSVRKGMKCTHVHSALRVGVVVVVSAYTHVKLHMRAAETASSCAPALLPRASSTLVFSRLWGGLCSLHMSAKLHSGCARFHVQVQQLHVIYARFNICRCNFASLLQKLHSALQPAVHARVVATPPAVARISLRGSSSSPGEPSGLLTFPSRCLLARPESWALRAGRECGRSAHPPQTCRMTPRTLPFNADRTSGRTWRRPAEMMPRRSKGVAPGRISSHTSWTRVGPPHWVDPSGRHASKRRRRSERRAEVPQYWKNSWRV